MKFLNKVKPIFLFLIILVFALSISCEKEDVLEPNPTISELPDDPDTRVRDFIWEGMNSWYLYQSDVPRLADQEDKNLTEYLSFLRSYENPESLFDGLLYQQNNKDRFSFIVDDYNELENQLQGISESYGYDFRLLLSSESSNELIGYIRYVLPGSPAELAGIRRGDLFSKVDGQQITTQNYQRLLFQKKSYKLGLFKIQNGQHVNDTIVDMTAEIIHENPILKTKVLKTSYGTKVGYLVYNGFNHLYHHELNTAFGDLKAQRIDELVLDLRYNPGGSVITAATLASMIYDGDPKKRFITFAYNGKHNDLDEPLNFLNRVYHFNSNFEVTGTEPLNSLGMDRVFILTSSGTASASEAVINGLRPYMDVILIGETTVGKNVGSRTLYDSPSSDYTDRATANSSHTYALQPLTTLIVNSNDFGAYESGFEPDIHISELNYLQDLKPLGSPDEPMLNAALNYISPTRSGFFLPENYDGSKLIPGPERKSENPFYRALVLDNLEKIK